MLGIWTCDFDDGHRIGLVKGPSIIYIVQQKLIGMVESRNHLVTIRCIKPGHLVEIMGLVELRNLALRGDSGR